MKRLGRSTLTHVNTSILANEFDMSHKEFNSDVKKYIKLNGESPSEIIEVSDGYLLSSSICDELKYFMFN